jgi:integrase
VHGKVRRKTLGKYGVLTVEQARIKAQKFLLTATDGGDPMAERREVEARQVTLATVFETYLQARKGLKPSTVHNYRRMMKEAFSDWLERPLGNISKDAVGRRHARIGARSPSQANNAMRVLRAMFNFAAGQYEDAEGRSLFPENPVSRLSHTRAWYRIDRRRTVIKRTELSAWFQGVMALKADSTDEQASVVADLLLLLLFTGLRRSEGLTLQWDNVDLREKTLTIQDTKNHEPLTLPLSDFLMELFQQRQKNAVSPYVFPGTGEYGHLIEPRPQMRKVTQQSGVTFTLHDLRRTFITVAESLDVPVYAIKRLVNHKMNQDVTAGYVVMDVERLRAPMQKITDHLLSLAQSSNVVPLQQEQGR